LVLLDSVVAAVPAEHPLARLDRIPIALLSELPLVRVARESSAVVHGLSGRIAAQAGVAFRPGPETDGILSTLGAVAAGLGFSFFPGYAERIRPDGVEVRPLDMDDPPEIELYVAYRKDDPNPGLQAFLRLLRELVCAKPSHGTVPPRHGNS
jgi:LysR family transcriptional regulator, hca operon transcriptional activator